MTVTLVHNHAAGCIVLSYTKTFTQSFAERSGDAAWADSASFSNQSGDTGNGTCSAIAISTGRVPGNYTFTATSATVFTAVDGTGAVLPNLTVGTPYMAGGLTFTITAGGTPYVANDVFRVFVKTAPDIVVVGPMGINDASAGATQAVIQSEASKLYKAIRATNPTIPIMWFGCQGIVTSAAQIVENGYTAALPTSDPYLLLVPFQYDTPAWMPPTAAGDIWFNPVTGHPSDAGSFWLAQRMATHPLVRNWIQAAIWP